MFSCRCIPLCRLRTPRPCAHFLPWSFDYVLRHKWFRRPVVIFLSYWAVNLEVLSPKPGIAKFLFCQIFLQVPSLKGYIDFISLENSLRKTKSSYTLLLKSRLCKYNFRILVLLQVELHYITNYLFLLFSLIEFSYHSLYCDLDKRSLLIRFCQNHNRITWHNVMEKQKRLAMPDTNIVIIHNTMLRNNSLFFSIHYFFSKNFQKQKHHQLPDC